VGQRTFSTSTLAVNDNLKYNNVRDLMLKLKVRDGKYYGLDKLIGNEDILFGAYNRIKSNPGNRTPGSDGQTLDGNSKNKKKIEEIPTELTKDTFQFKPS
jgi:hypothetical protein